MIVTLETTEQTLAFGQKLGQVLMNMVPLPTILLHGDLGAGKTTMVRGLVAGLPGADMAEVTSPSFNLVNLYPTRPPVAHVDLYRLEQGFLGDDVLDAFEDERSLTIVEWAERLNKHDTPPLWIRLDWKMEGTLRRVEIRANTEAIQQELSTTLAYER